VTYPNRPSYHDLYKIKSHSSIFHHEWGFSFALKTYLPLLPCDLSLHERLHIRVFNVIKPFVCLVVVGPGLFGHPLGLLLHCWGCLLVATAAVAAEWVRKACKVLVWRLPEVFHVVEDPASDACSTYGVALLAGNNLRSKPSILVFDSHNYTLEEVKGLIAPLVSVGYFLELLMGDWVITVQVVESVSCTDEVRDDVSMLESGVTKLTAVGRVKLAGTGFHLHQKLNPDQRSFFEIVKQLLDGCFLRNHLVFSRGAWFQCFELGHGKLVSFAGDVDVQVSLSRDSDPAGHAGQVGLTLFQLELVKLLDPSLFVFKTSVEAGISKSGTQILSFPS